MLSFLGKIRKSLIESGSARKYLLNAIGEIILVVIGILIALQINTWNEWWKDRKLEKATLQEIRFDLQREIARMSDDIVQMQNSMDIIANVINHIEAKFP